ncbi:unnamed protein product [Adineta steineri]|uniref:VWFA domain-containing protein n=1 Tax=Adineta steineri TaxID=433720 RepID=A0A814ETY8_9BILA|nr:unnamed protein product [Adineta steineri]CAF3743487.1 unnamed protein product [Adineta steineri]
MEISTESVRKRQRQIYNQGSTIYNQLKDFVNENPLQRRTLTMFTYQQARKFRDDIEKYFRIEPNLTNQWSISVENLWNLIKPYQNVFSSSNSQTIQENLQTTIQSLHTETISQRLSSLVYLKTIPSTFASRTIIENYLNSTENSCTKQSINEYELFFNFIQKSRSLLNFLLQFSIIQGERSSNEFYRITPKLIEKLEKIFSSILNVTEIENGYLNVSEKYSRENLEEFQRILDQYLDQLNFPRNLKIRLGLTDFISKLSPIYDENRAIPKLSSSFTPEKRSNSFHIHNTKEILRQGRQTSVDESIIKLTELLSNARQLPWRPHNLIGRIHLIINKFKNFDIENDTETELKKLRAEQTSLFETFMKIQCEMKNYTSFEIHLPADTKIHEITEKELTFKDPSTTLYDSVENFQTILEQISIHNQSQSFPDANKLLRLAHTYVSNRIWVSVMSRLSGTMNNQLKNDLILLNDDLAIQAGTEITKELIVNVTIAYAQYRYDLLNEERSRDMISNYSSVSKLINELRNWMEQSHLNVFNILENIKSISDNLTQAENQRKSFPAEISCSLLPIEIRPEDLICLFTPEYSTVIGTITEKIDQLDKYFSCQINQIDPIQLSSTEEPKGAAHFGLASFFYSTETSENSFLFDRKKHIYYIFDKTISYLGKLINLTIEKDQEQSNLLRISTSYKELFPLHISLSLALMILINWSATCLKENFQSFVRYLTLTTTKQQFEKINNLQKRIGEENTQLNKLKSEISQAKNDTKSAKYYYESAMNAEYVVRNKRKQYFQQCQEREEELEIVTKKQENSVNDLEDEIKDLNRDYQNQLKDQQNRWFENVHQSFVKISEEIRKFIYNLIVEKRPMNQLTHEDFLSILISLAREDLRDPRKTPLKLTEIEKLEKNLQIELEILSLHSNQLTEKDPMRSYLKFHSEIFLISFASLRNSFHSWSLYIGQIQTSEMKSFIDNNRKEILCRLNLSICDQCVLFIENIRLGHEQSEVMELGQKIYKNLQDETKELDLALTGEQFSDKMKHLIEELERFVVNLVIIGCRYLQLQRGTRESLDDLLFGITTETIDSHLPRKEFQLLQLLDTCEIQLKSHSDTLLYQTLHLTFQFNSNPFTLSDYLDRSAKALIELILPTAHMIQQMWLTLTELINKISPRMSLAEFDILHLVGEDFLQLIDRSCEISNESDFIRSQFESKRFEIMSEHIEKLGKVLIENRSEMKNFVEDMKTRWNLTLKEILKGFIKAKRFNIQKQVEWHRRINKNYELLFSKENSREKDEIRLADIDQIVRRKNFTFKQIDLNLQRNYFEKLQYFQIIHHLYLNGLNNLGTTLMNIPTQYVHHGTLLPFVETITNLYKQAEQVLLEQPLAKSINNKELINESFQSLETIHRLELKTFQELFFLSIKDLKIHYDKFLLWTDFQSIVDRSIQAVERWKLAGNAFIRIREKERSNTENLRKKFAKTLSKVGETVLRMFSSSSETKNNDQTFRKFLEELKKRMQWEQLGNKQIFTLATSQSLVKKIVDLHHRYQTTLRLTQLNEQEFFRISRHVCIFEFYCLNNSIQSIKLHLWEKEQNNSTSVFHIDISRGKFDLVLVANISIVKVSIEIFSELGPMISWTNLVDQRYMYIYSEQLQMTCHLNNSNEYFYTVENSIESMNENETLSPNDLNNLIENIDEKFRQQINQQKEEIIWSKSPIIDILQSFVDNFKRISQLLQTSTINDEDLSSSTNIFNLFQKLPRIAILQQILDLIQPDQTLMIIPTHIVDDHEASIHLNLDQVWTNTMKNAFQVGKDVLIDVSKRLQHLLFALRLTKSHVILSYTWSNALTININNESEQEFLIMSNDCQEFLRFRIPNQIESIKHQEECKRIVNEANQIYRMMKRSGNTLNDVKRLVDIQPFLIDENIDEGYVHSQMDRDVHLWLTDDNQTKSIVSQPQLTILDFGIALSGVHQRIVQHVFIHNHSGKVLSVGFDRKPGDENVFDVITENLSIDIGEMAEFEFLLRPPTSIKIFDEGWDLIIDGQTVLSNAVKASVRIVRIDVEVPTDPIDFGFVPSNGQSIERTIFLNNVLPCPVRVKAQLQLTEISNRQSKIILLDDELDLPAESKLPFRVALEPAYNTEEVVEADIALAVDTRKNIKWINIKADVRKSHLTVLYQNRIIIDDAQSGELLIEDFYKGEKRLISLEFFNSGPVEYTLYLSSNEEGLVIPNPELKLDAAARRIVQIQVKLLQIAHRNKFSIDISFLNIRRRCKLILICQTATPIIEYRTSRADEHHLITINDEHYRQDIWNSTLNILNPIQHQVTFINTGTAVATLRFDKIVTGEDSSLLLTNCFDAKPNELVVSPKSEAFIDLLYHPKDFRPFDAVARFLSNASTEPIKIPYHLKFHTPVAHTIPRITIDSGVIQLGTTFRKKLLIVENCGQCELQFHFSGPFRKHPIVKNCDLETISSKAIGSERNEGFAVSPKKKISFNVMVEFQTADSLDLPNVIALCGYELITECDPIINIQGMLVDRKLILLVIGYTKSLPPFVQPIESDCRSWSSLKLLSSKWLYEINTNYQSFQDYSALIIFTAIGFICGSQKTNAQLPTSSDEWRTFCTQISNNDEKLSLDMFHSVKNNDRALLILSNNLRNTDVNSSYYYSFFYHSALLYGSFTNDESIALQLFSVVNSASDTNDAYVMQNYSNILWKIYKVSTVNDAHRQAICLVYQCVGKDPNMPKHVLNFVQFLSEALNAKTSTEIIKQLSSKMPKGDAVSELLTLPIDGEGSFRWPLLFVVVSDRVRDLVIKLIHEDYQTLLDVNINSIDAQPFNAWKRKIFQMTNIANQSWNTFSTQEKTNHLEPFFVDYPNFLPVITALMTKKSPILSDLMSITRIIFERVNPSQNFEDIRYLFQATAQSDIIQRLNRFPRLCSTRFTLASTISQLTKSIVNDSADRQKRSSHISKFCEIIAQIAPMTNDQWKTTQSCIVAAWSLHGTVTEADSRLNDVVEKSLELLHSLDVDKQWLFVKDAFIQFRNQPSWSTVHRFVHVVNNGLEINNLAQKLNKHSKAEEMAADVLQLCRYLRTDDEPLLLENDDVVRNFSSAALTNIEILKKIVNFMSGLLKEKIYLFLQSMELFEQMPSDANINSQCQLDTLVPMWQILFDINCTLFKRILEAISSILTSFHGLVLSKGNPFCQHLYTTNVAAALCTLSHYRLNNREMGAPLILLPSVPSIMSIIRERIIHQNPSPTTTLLPPTNPLDEPSWKTPVSRKSSKALIEKTSLYSPTTLIKMQNSVEEYIRQMQPSTVPFNESDTVQKIVDTAFDYRLRVAKWYDAFMTFNVLIHHSMYSTSSNQNSYGARIVKYGLQLLRDLVVARLILEPTFTRTGVRFILDNSTRLENCLRSLALERCPNLRNTLCLLHVDISRLQSDFKPPARSFGAKGKTIRKFRFDLDPHQLTVPSTNSAEETFSPIQLSTEQENITLSKADWENAIQQEIRKKTSFYGPTAKTAQKPTGQKKSDERYAARNRVQKLASDMLKQKSQTTYETGFSVDHAQITDSFGSINTNVLPEINFEFQFNHMREHVKDDKNLIEMYKQANQKVSSFVPEGKLDHRPALKVGSPPSKWTYQLLIETSVIARMIDLLVQGFRDNWERLCNQTNSHELHEIRWCIMIDNSGSMSIHRNAIYESLVVLMELLRKLEHKFAVARFGGRTNQKILKDLDALFTNQDGQFVLEALTFDEGTYPATGLARVADFVFPEGKTKSSSGARVHQFVVMLTDGLTQEREDATYAGTTSKHDIELGILFIETNEAETSTVLLDHLKKVESVVIKSDKMADLPHTMPQLLHKMVIKCFGSTLKKREFIPPATVQVAVPNYDGTTPVPSKAETESLKYVSHNPSSYTISSPAAEIPNLALLQSELSGYLTSTTDFTNCASSAIEKLRQYYQSLKPSAAIREAEKTWLSDENRFSALIDDISTVLGDVVFPFNKFTRRRAALRGSSLYMPGVIKAMTSEWSYKKIFGAKLAGGKRDHAVCLVIDVSTSMLGTLSMGTLESIVVLIAALRKITIDSFSIVVFGQDTRLIKTNEQGWDALTIYTLMQGLRFDLDQGTRDAHAIETAVDLLTQISTHGQKKIFILTDGYGSCGSHLTMVQQRAEENSIDIIAMAIGIDRTSLEIVYKRYLQCATVYGLPRALRALFENDTQLTSLDWSLQKVGEDAKATRALLEGLLSSVQSEKIFGPMIEELAGQRDMKLIERTLSPPDITVDICFCLDCTGSMSRWIGAVKIQLKEIISKIKTAILKKHEKLKIELRFAIVGYRDVQDDPRFFVLDFTSDVTVATEFVHGLTASGGNDLPEDVLGALHKCLILPGWKANNARFIVVITDAPGHGELNTVYNDDYPQV